MCEVGGGRWEVAWRVDSDGNERIVMGFCEGGRVMMIRRAEKDSMLDWIEWLSSEVDMMRQ